MYLDYNGSASLDPRVLDEMLPILAEGVGNASSSHRFGRRQSAAVDEAREQVAALMGGHPGNVVFTAGSTESNNLALRGVVEGGDTGRPRVLVSAVEHASFLRTAGGVHRAGRPPLLRGHPGPPRTQVPPPRTAPPLRRVHRRRRPLPPRRNPGPRRGRRSEPHPSGDTRRDGIAR